MNLNELKQAGGFASDQLVKRQITWKKSPEDTVTFEVHIAKPSYGEMERIMGEEGRSKGAAMIALCVRLGEHGDEPISYDQAYDMLPSLVDALTKVVIEVNGIKKDAAKN
ncbi:hypothetical protein A6D6_02696 [Alcanivorax xiamenensis]|uniref:Phage tail assembly chaperone n=1 Tax=Alcanivorax xiamenensis TaxID=1177156 RepID=A0ABQ6Y768_9GAMM|nr:phage tail assembly chaperone family protein, TAC [Alcanivorax xiamenensis]KAF0804932.1 hypothetical protein A6D6_02696 [Alcanivorax xiamenensis]